MEAGFDAGNLSRIERGIQQPTIKKLESIAQALHVTVADLFKMVEPIADDPPVTHLLRDDGAVYHDDMQAMRRGFAALDGHHRKMALEFIKLLQRFQHGTN